MLVAAVWLCLKGKYFNSRTAKEACESFEVQAKQLSKLLSGKKYLGSTAEGKHMTEKKGPKDQLKRKKSIRVAYAIKDEEKEEGEEEEEEVESALKKKMSHQK